jgi:sulfatase maturation enzyme AslB (radical SAM superfamily)
MSTELQNFCAAPWGSIFYHTNSARICCAHHDFIENTGIAEFKKMDFIRDIRQSFLEDKKHNSCGQCWSLEEHGMSSVRQYVTEQCPSIDQNSVTVDSEHTVDYLELRDGNLCNMACIMCSPNDSSVIQSEIEENPKLFGIFKNYTNIINNKDKISDERWRELYEIAPTLRSLHLTGGEPMLSKNFKMYLEYILEHGRDDIHLHISTNASVVNDQLISIFNRFNDFTMNISIDGVGDVAEYHRYGSSWDKISSNIEQLIALKGTFSLGTTITAISILDISNLTKYLISVHQKNPYIHFSWRCSTNLSYTSLSGLAKERALDQIAQTRNIINEYNHLIKQPFNVILQELDVYENTLKSKTNINRYTELVKDIGIFDSIRTKTFESTFGFKL